MILFFNMMIIFVTIVIDVFLVFIIVVVLFLFFFSHVLNLISLSSSQELDKISSEKSKFENEGEKQAAKMKTIEEDRNRLQKSASTQQSAVSKQKQVVDDLKAKLAAAETQASTLKRQNEQLQRDVKTQQNNVGATEVRERPSHQNKK